jgi:hypothetical protein
MRWDLKCNQISTLSLHQNLEITLLKELISEDCFFLATAYLCFSFFFSVGRRNV